MPKYKMDSKKYLSAFIDDMNDNGCVIKAFIADNLKRANARDSLNHASSFACEYCFSKASTFSVGEQQINMKKRNIQNQMINIENHIKKAKEKEEPDQEEIETLQLVLTNLNTSLKDIDQKKKQLVWPSSTMKGEPRTTAKIISIVERIENGENLSKDEKKGIVGRSPFLKLPYFDIVRDIPCEYLHSTCIGVVKRLIILTFNVGISRPRLTKRKLTPPSVFNALMSAIKVVREFSRRARSLDISVLKGQEYRNIGLFFFIIVVQCLDDDNTNERRIWLLLGYMLRACVIPNNEFQNVNLSDIDYCGKHFYSLYEKTFGEMNCSYNTHIVGAHMIEMRAHGPLTLTSAFGFEHFYGEMRHCFVPSTISPLKQILQKVLLKRALSDHQCCPTTHITTHNTALECNNLIYTFTHRQYNFFKVVDINNETGILYCVKINTTEVFFDETPNLNWDHVGVFKQESMEKEPVKINLKFVAGKVIKIDNILMSCPMNVLNEK